jgi:hypothetical protein
MHVELVVAVQEGHPRSARRRQTSVTGGATAAAVLRKPEVAHPWIKFDQPVRDDLRVIRGAVIADDHLQRTQRLRQGASYGCGKPIGIVVDDDHHADVWHAICDRWLRDVNETL